MHSFPRPTNTHLHVERQLVDGACGECGEETLAEYRVLSEGGWWDVRKCQTCFASMSRQPAPRYGSYTPLGLQDRA